MLFITSTEIKTFVLRVLPTLFLLVLSFLNYGRIRASFEPTELYPYVEINGVDFGRFNFVEGVTEHSYSNLTSGHLKRVSLKRHFVTDPPLSGWARQNFENNTLPQSISIVYKNKDGLALASYTLTKCKPQSWTLEAADEASGGYKESIELAVREVKLKPFL